MNKEDKITNELIEAVKILAVMVEQAEENRKKSLALVTGLSEEISELDSLVKRLKTHVFSESDKDG